MVVLQTPSLHDKSIQDPQQNMFWFHCNGCYCQPQPDHILRFFITNCSHIYCDNCVTACTKEKCKICHSECSTLELSGKLQGEVERLFTDPGQLLQAACKQMQSALQAIEFQKSHQRRLFRHSRNQIKQQHLHLAEMNKLVARCRSMEKEFIELKKENHYLKCLHSKSEPHGRSNTNNAHPGSAGFQVTSNRRSPYGIYQKMAPSQELNKLGSSNILNYPGRILMRPSPMSARLGTNNGSYSFAATPRSDSKSNEQSISPLTVPRPIYLSQTD